MIGIGWSAARATAKVAASLAHGSAYSIHSRILLLSGARAPCICICYYQMKRTVHRVSHLLVHAFMYMRMYTFIVSIGERCVCVCSSNNGSWPNWWRMKCIQKEWHRTRLTYTRTRFTFIYFSILLLLLLLLFFRLRRPAISPLSHFEIDCAVHMRLPPWHCTWMEHRCVDCGCIHSAS